MDNTNVLERPNREPLQDLQYQRRCYSLIMSLNKKYPDIAAELAQTHTDTLENLELDLHNAESKWSLVGRPAK